MIPGYSIKAKGKKECEILIYEEIGEGWYGGITAKQFTKDLRDQGDVETITLRINSPGGNVFDGNAIYNVLKQHSAKKIVHIDGLAASIASVIAMAGDEIHIADNAMMMIHNAWGVVMGFADDMRKAADMLEKVDASIATTYQKRTGLDIAKIKELMQAETWMNSKEALEYGFVDDITDALEVAACFDLSKFKYRNTPKQLAQCNASRDKLAHMNLVSQKIRIASNLEK